MPRAGAACGASGIGGRESRTEIDANGVAGERGVSEAGLWAGAVDGRLDTAHRRVSFPGGELKEPVKCTLLACVLACVK